VSLIKLGDTDHALAWAAPPGRDLTVEAVTDGHTDR
jgi:hypothetical protein